MRGRDITALTVLYAFASCSAVAAPRAPPAAIAVAPPAQPEAPRPLIEGAQAIFLVRMTLMSIHDANITGNYTVLRELGSPSLQRKSASALAQSFKPLRLRKLDLFTAASTIPSFTAQPGLDVDHLLHLKGVFTTRPEAVAFDFAFEAVEGVWKPASLGLALQAAN